MQTTEKGLFTARSDDTTITVCLDEGPAPPSLDFCVPSSAVSSVNLPSSSTLSVVKNQKASMSFLSQQLCIVDSNSAELGKYFTDPGHATEATLAAARTREIGKFFNPDPNAVAAAEAVKTAAATSAQYRVNDTIAATGAPGGVFTLPGKTLSGTCGYTNVVGFGLPIPSAIDSYASECDVDLSTLETACTGSTLNSVNLVDNLRLASTKGSSPTMITPSVSSAKYRTRVGGYEQDVVASGGGAISKTSVYTSGTKTCSFAVAEAHWTLTHDGAGSLSSATVDLVYAEVYHPEGSAYTSKFTNIVAPSTPPNSLRQKFTVTFVKTGDTPVPKSGSPGYVVGAPLLAGYSTENTVSGVTKTAVTRLTDGLPIPGAGPDGRCGVNYKSTVRFGMSQSSSCAVPLTVSGLEAYCGGATSSGSVDDYMDIIATTTTGVADTVHPDSPTVPLPVQLTDGLLYATATDGLTLDAKTTLIAGWADASYLNVADWKACSTSDETDCATVVTGLTAPTLAMAWDSDTRTCSNVPIGINIDILTAKVGTMDNPQSRVSRVELSWEYGSWTYADPYAASSTRQDFMLKSTARFVEMDQASAEGVTPATPPIFPALPADVFFPFLSAAPAGGRAAASAAWWMALGVAFVAAVATSRHEHH